MTARNTPTHHRRGRRPQCKHRRRSAHTASGPRFARCSSGPPIGTIYPPSAMADGVARATDGSSAVRTPARYPTSTPGPFGPRWSQCRSGKFGRGTGRPPGGAANEPWKERFFSRAVCSPPRPTRPRGSTTAGRDRIDALGRRLRQTGDVGWIANEAEPGGACGRGAASRAAGDDPRGQGGHRETARGLQTSLGKNVLFKGGLQPPPGGPGLKAVLERPCSPIPCDEGEDLLKGGRSRGISGECGGLACIHAHFPVKNQVIP